MIIIHRHVCGIILYKFIDALASVPIYACCEKVLVVVVKKVIVVETVVVPADLADEASRRRILHNEGITSGEIFKSLPITCKTIGEPRYYRSPEEKDEFRLNSRRLNGDWKEYANLL